MELINEGHGDRVRATAMSIEALSWSTSTSTSTTRGGATYYRMSREPMPASSSGKVGLGNVERDLALCVNHETVLLDDLMDMLLQCGTDISPRPGS